MINLSSPFFGRDAEAALPRWWQYSCSALRLLSVVAATCAAAYYVFPVK